MEQILIDKEKCISEFEERYLDQSLVVEEYNKVVDMVECINDQPTVNAFPIQFDIGDTVYVVGRKYNNELKEYVYAVQEYSITNLIITKNKKSQVKIKYTGYLFDDELHRIVDKRHDFSDEDIDNLDREMASFYCRNTFSSIELADTYLQKLYNQEI